MNGTFLIVSILSWLSVLSCVWIILTYLCFEKNRSFPRRMVLYIVIGVLCYTFPFLVNSILGVERVICESPTEASTAPWCIVGAALVVIGVNWTLFWWLIQAFHLFYIVQFVPPNTRAVVWLEKWYHLIGWAPGIALGIAAAVEGEFGGNSMLPYCFFKDTTPYQVGWTYFFGPLVFCTLLVALFVFLSIFRIFRTSTESTPIIWRFEMHARILSFIGLFGFSCLCSLALFVRNEVADPDFSHRFSDYVSCISNSTAHCPSPHIGAPGLFYLNAIVIGWQGMWLLLIFGTSKMNISLWHYACCSTPIAKRMAPSSHSQSSLAFGHSNDSYPLHGTVNSFSEPAFASANDYLLGPGTPYSPSNSDSEFFFDDIAPSPAPITIARSLFRHDPTIASSVDRHAMLA